MVEDIMLSHDEQAATLAESLCMKFGTENRSPKVSLSAMALTAASIIEAMRRSIKVDFLPEFLEEIKKRCGEMGAIIAEKGLDCGTE